MNVSSVEKVAVWCLVAVGLSLIGPGQVMARPNDTNRIFISPGETVVSSIGNSFDIFIALDSSVATVHGYRAKVRFDTTIIRLDTIVPTPEWNAAGSGFFAYKDSLEVGIPNGDSSWFYDIGSFYLGQSLFIDGYANVARMRFTALQTGASPVYFSFILVQDTLLNSVTDVATGGAVFVCPFPPDFAFYGDLDNTGTVDIADLTIMIDNLFINFTPLEPLELMGDVNCDGLVDIADLTVVIDHLFINFVELCNLCP